MMSTFILSPPLYPPGPRLPDPWPCFSGRGLGPGPGRPHPPRCPPPGPGFYETPLPLLQGRWGLGERKACPPAVEGIEDQSPQNPEGAHPAAVGLHYDNYYPYTHGTDASTAPCL